MKSFRIKQYLQPLAATLFLGILLLASGARAQNPDAVEVAGDLKVNAIHFSADGSVQSQACPWSYNGANIGFTLGSVGIGTLTPAARLDVDGTVKATQFSGDGSGLANIWKTSGNAGTTPGTQFIGTTDANALEIKVNNQRAIRVEPGATGASSNIVAGSAANSAGSFDGATVSGGGRAGTDCVNPDTGQHTRSCPNFALGDFAVIGGGLSNTASAAYNTICGGLGNTASGINYNTVSGGRFNTANGNSSTVSGGYYNTASGYDSTVSGGYDNQASNNYSTVAGGYGNEASGHYSIVVGGFQNIAGGNGSLAAGTNARIRDAVAAGNTNGDEGTFLWSDAHGVFFYSIAANEFAARALGGFRFVTAIDGNGVPTQTTVIDGNGNVGIGATAPTGPLNVTAGNVTSGTLWAGTANVNGFEVGGSGTDRYVSMKRDGADKSVLHITKSDAGKLVTFFINGAEKGVIKYDGANTLYTSTSDARLKENIRPTAFGVDDLMKLEVKDYTFKADTNGTVLTGFLAQDLYQVIPQAVTVGGDDPATKPWQVDYGKLTPFLVKAVQDLKTENDLLKERLERLEKMLAAGRQ